MLTLLIDNALNLLLILYVSCSCIKVQRSHTERTCGVCSWKLRHSGAVSEV